MNNTKGHEGMCENENKKRYERLERTFAVSCRAIAKANDAVKAAAIREFVTDRIAARKALG